MIRLTHTATTFQDFHGVTPEIIIESLRGSRVQMVAIAHRVKLNGRSNNDEF